MGITDKLTDKKPKLEKANLISPWIDAVVHAPQGALPTSCHPLYGLDGESILAYSEQVNDHESWSAFIDQWLVS